MKLERVLNYGIRVIYFHSHSEHSGQLRKRLKWMSIEKRREMARAVLVQRCVMKKA